MLILITNQILLIGYKHTPNQFPSQILCWERKWTDKNTLYSCLFRPQWLPHPHGLYMNWESCIQILHLAGQSMSWFSEACVVILESLRVTDLRNNSSRNSFLNILLIHWIRISRWWGPGICILKNYYQIILTCWELLLHGNNIPFSPHWFPVTSISHTTGLSMRFCIKKLIIRHVLPTLSNATGQIRQHLSEIHEIWFISFW